MKDANSAAVLWFTGLSGAGKTTVAAAVERQIRSLGVRTEYLDGDVLRELAPTGFTKAERDVHVKRVGFLASRLEHHDVTVLCALISPYAEARDHVRRLCRRYVEIYVATSLAECERRDVKGLYARARRGELRHFTGIDDPYEPPVNPDLVLDTGMMSVEHAVDQVVALWSDRTERHVRREPAGAQALEIQNSRHAPTYPGEGLFRFRA